MSAAVEPCSFKGQTARRLIASDGSMAVVLEHGAHVVSWQPHGGAERLYLSDRTAYGDGRAIRGGVPVIFPQFNERGPLLRHGFARLRRWEVERADVVGDDALAVLRLRDDAETRAGWEQSFVAELTVLVSADRLDIELTVENSGATPFRFTAALHTYLAVTEVETVRIEGLSGLRYEDFAGGGAMHTDASPSLTISDEVDRVYFDLQRPLLLREPHRNLTINQEGFSDVVVWNPWETRAAQLPDLPPRDFRRYVCVEAAQIGMPVQLAPGAEWAGRQSLSAG